MGPLISMDALLDALAQRGLSTEHEARAVLRATLSVLGERLADDEAKLLAEVLPADLAASVENAEYDSDFAAAELFERVRRRHEMPLGRATECAEIALAALGECLGPDRRRRIARGLPVEAGRLLLGERVTGEPPPHSSASRAPKLSTLASARPGSTHPLSESAPPGGHTHSVARNPSPHAETKLSASKGLTQERLDDTLSAGRPPGPARPIADSRSK